MNPTPLITLSNLRHEYQGKPVLQADRLNIFPGTITGLAGPNGSGKSTLLSILGLVLKPSSGTMAFREDRVAPSCVWARRKITLLTQEPYLLKRSVFNNVAYGLMVRKETAHLQERVFKALATVGLSPERFAHRHAHELSGGEARRVALAARLALDPDVLLLDEPTTHVDETSSRMIRNAVIQNCRDRQTTLVVSSHDREWLDSISDRVLTLYKGRIYDHGRINIIHGPWTQGKDGTFEGLPGTDAQGFPVPAPPHGNAVAIIPSQSLNLSLSSEPVPGEALSISCLVTGVHLEPKHMNWIVALKTGNLTLTATLASGKACLVRPGEPVLAYYLPHHMMYV